MTTEAGSYLTIGKIGAPHGIRGWLKVHSFAEYGASILDYSPWYLNGPEGRKLANIEETNLHGQQVLVKLAGIDTPEAARLMTGLLIEIERSLLPKLGPQEFYWSDLVGLKVINQRGELLGVVSYLMETGSNDVMVIKNDREHAIPYRFGTVIKQVDLDKGEIHVDWELI